MAKEGMGIGLTSLGIGAVFIYGGIQGYSPLRAIQNIIQGKSGSFGQSPSLLTDTGGTNSSVSTGGMADKSVYSSAELVQLWTSNGGDPGAARNAACHGMQESGGRATVTSANPDGGINVGIWQLDTKGKGAGHTIAELQNPNTNAKITIQATGNGRDWSAWATPGC